MGKKKEKYVKKVPDRRIPRLIVLKYGGYKARYKVKYSISRRGDCAIPLNFHRIRAINGFLFIREKERTCIYLSSRVYQSTTRASRYAIKTTNDMGRKQYVSFLHQCRISFPLAILPLSRYQPLFLSFVPSWSLPCAQPVVVRGVCSGSLTCCMLFCPGPSARFCFSEPFHAALILSGTPERHSRNKKPAYCVPRCEIL